VGVEYGKLGGMADDVRRSRGGNCGFQHYIKKRGIDKKEDAGSKVAKGGI